MRNSRYCRPRTPPATSPRSPSACRCASGSAQRAAELRARPFGRRRHRHRTGRPPPRSPKPSWPSSTASRRLRRAGGSQHDTRHLVGLPGHGLRHVHGDPRHPDRLASLADIQAGVRPARMSVLGADQLSHRRSGDHAAVGLLSRMLSTRILFTALGRGLHRSPASCAPGTSIDEMIVWRALQGFIGGAMIPSVFATSFAIFPPESGRSDAAHRHDRDPRPHHRPDRRRLSHRALLLALAVPRQRRPRHRGDRRLRGS